MQHLQKTTLPFILFALAALMLAGCTGSAIIDAGILGADFGIMYLTKRGDPLPADTADQIAPHESWCYETMGYAECYSCPQDVPPGRLINVDPQNRYPLNVRAYNEALIQCK